MTEFVDMGDELKLFAYHHLDDYLDEFTFRLDRRTSALPGKLFYRLAQRPVQVELVPFPIPIKPQPMVLGGAK